MELNELITVTDIISYIGQFIELEQRGNEWWGLSCFRNEKTPSFSIRKDPPFWYDYSSGQGGNVFNFITRYFKCSGREAVEKLKAFNGVTEDVFVPGEKLSATLVCKRFSRQQNQKKRDKNAGALPEDYMSRFERPDDKLAVWEKEGISRASLDKFQVCYDSFSNRLVYPIRNFEGDIVNIGGRTLCPDWKEKKLRKYTYFYPWNGGMDVIYGVSENMVSIQKKKEVILFEGCKSVLLADTWGINNAGAILTSHLSNTQFLRLIQLGCTTVFALDKDVDPTQDKNIQKLKRYVNVLIIQDKDGELDAKDAPVDKGKEVFERLYEQRTRIR